MTFRGILLFLFLLGGSTFSRADSAVVFNEIMYHPLTNETELEWVELHNVMSVDMDLSHWSLAKGIDYTFPEGTILRGGEFLVVALSPATLMAQSGISNVVGPFSGRLSNSGETLELRNNNNRAVDSVSYQTEGDWPVAPDGSGVSLARKNILSATSDASNWIASREIGGTPGLDNFPAIVPTTITTTLLGIGGNWKFNDSGTALGEAWRSAEYDDSSWPEGPALFYRGDATLPAAKQTLLSPGRTTYYFRKAFEFSGDTSHLQIQLRPLIDDGAVFFLNGAEIARFNMPNENITYSTLAGSPVGDASFAEPILISGNQLINGTNVLAVEVHQAASTVGYPEAILNSSPIAYWRLGDSGNPAIDSASSISSPQMGAQPGNFSGLPSTNLAQAGPRPGDIVGIENVSGFEANNGAPRFSGNNDGGNDVVTINDSGVFNFTTNRAFSVEAWVKGTSSQESGAAIVAKGIGGGGEQFAIDVISGAYRFFVRDNSSSHNATGANAAIGPNGSWQYIVADFDQSAGLMRLYVNGVSVASATPPSTLLDTQHEISIGSRKLNSSSGYSLNFDGSIDEVAIYNRALPESEIANHFNAAFASGAGSEIDTNDVIFGLELSTLETIPPPVAINVAFNELSSVTNGFWLELMNSGSSNVDLGGFSIATIGGDVGEYILPSQILSPGGFQQITASSLGFPISAGDRLVLYNPDKTRVLDAVIAKDELRGRFPDGTGAWLIPNVATPGTSNSFIFHDEIVINEIMYHHYAEFVTNESPESWVEIFNRGSNAVDLTGWKFTEGISFNFPSNKVIAAGGFLVVAKDPAYLSSLYPGIDVVGPFSGNLSKSGESLVLIDANKNPADVVHYFDGGRWHQNADAGGSSLELRDPRADNTSPEAWSASLEENKSGWQTYTYRGVAQTTIPNSPTNWNEFLVGLIDGAGEVLLDDISVVENPDASPVQFTQNGSFNGGSSAHWRFLGNHRHSFVESEPGNPANYVLHLVATGASEYQGNQIETTFNSGKAVVDGLTYEISFRAKWLAGKNLLNTRLYFNRLAQSTRLTVPALNGTPGAINSVYATNIGPTFAELHHDPAVPNAGEPVTVSVVPSDPDGVNLVRLWYAVEGVSWNSLTMSNLASGRFTATLPGQSAGTLVQFYIEGRDSSNVVSFFPPGGTNSRALYRVDDGQAVSSPHNFRVLMTQSDANFMHNSTNVLSNEYLGGTVIYDENEIFYDIGVRLKGSFVGRDVPRVGFNISFDATQLFRGIFDRVAIDRSQHTGIGQGEIIAKHIASHAGEIPNMYDDLVQFIAPRAQDTSRAQLRMAGFDDIYLDSQFNDGSDGSMYEFEVIRYSKVTADGTSEGIKLPSGGGYVNPDIANYGDDPENYRWIFLKSNNRTRDDYTRLILMAKAFSLSGANLDIQSQSLMDVDEWLRTFAYESLVGVSDAYFTGGNRHNFRMYVRPEDQKVLAMPWDWDSSFSRSPSASLVGIDNFAKIVSLPNNLRAYENHLYDIISSTFNVSYMTRWTEHYGTLAGQDFSGILNYIGQRSDYVLSHLPTDTPFAITSNNGGNFSTNASQVTLTGTAPIQVKTIRLNDVAYFTSWSDLTNWSLTLPLNVGPNTLVAQGYDGNGDLLANMMDSISILNSDSNSTLPVIINEWMADNAAPGGFVDPVDGTYQDWFELYNPNTVSVDLSGFFLTDTLSLPTKWKIPTNTIITPKGFLLVWADGKTNLNGIGGSGDLHSSFSLAKGGEEIGLFGTNGVTPQSTIVFQNQTENVSQGFFPDGRTNHAYLMANFTPRSPNILPDFNFIGSPIRNDLNELVLEWSTIPAEIYRLQFKSNLSDLDWMDVGTNIVAPGDSIRLAIPMNSDAQRFFRVKRIE